MRVGRRPVTTHGQIETIALNLFERDGFDLTTMEAIARAAGISRRTVFRYFPTKNDIVWGDFDWVLSRLREHLEEGSDLAMMEALRRAVVLSNRYEDADLPQLRIRMTLITTVPALQAHSMLRYEAWSTVVSDFVAQRLNLPPDHLTPQVLGRTALGTSMAAFARWVRYPSENLVSHLDAGFRLLEGRIGPGLEPRTP